MGLLKTKNEKGVDCNYWKIKEAHNLYLQDKTSVVLGLYFNKDVRDVDASAVQFHETISVDGSDYTRAQLYVKIKEPTVVEGINPETGEPDIEYQVVTPSFFSDAEDLI